MSYALNVTRTSLPNRDSTPSMMEMWWETDDEPIGVLLTENAMLLTLEGHIAYGTGDGGLFTPYLTIIRPKETP